MKNLFIVMLLSFAGLSAVANNPIVSASLQLDDQGTLGNLFSEYKVVYKVTLEENSDVIQIHCLIDASAEENLIDVWVNVDGTNNGSVLITTDINTGELIIDLGIYELPLTKDTKVEAKTSNGVIHSPVQVI